jgi:hypothetical protein
MKQGTISPIVGGPLHTAASLALRCASAQVRAGYKQHSEAWHLYYLPERRYHRMLVDRASAFFGEEPHHVLIENVHQLDAEGLAQALRDNLFTSHVAQFSQGGAQ